MNWSLDVFPVDSVALTLTTSVWVGVVVVAFFNLRLGWTMSGLVIPGYLVPLIMCHPTAAVVICCESLLTFWLVRAISEGPRRLPYWCGFFGRDRFLALILGSVIVRAVLEGWLLPWLGPHINELCGYQLDYRNDLHSYGLIIVSLIANYFWKPGVIRGFSAMSVTVGITFLIVRFGLIELTNLNVADVSNLYEDISASLLASPKAYIVILTSALVASWLNLRYSWDYNGILVPSLLALLWHSPSKVFASFLEAGVLLLLATLVLKLPIFRKTTIAGIRRTSLFFTICFLYRLGLCHICQRFFPAFYVTDFFGFGYLLTTLLAIKAHEKKLTVRIVKSTIQASTLGAVAGNLCGFVMTLLPMSWLSPMPVNLWAAPNYAGQTSDHSLPELIRQDKLLLYQQKAPESFSAPLFGETSHFIGGVQALKRYIEGGDELDLNDAQARLRAAHFDLLIVRDRYIYLRERGPIRGWGVYVFDMANTGGLVIEAPFPLDERTIEPALSLFENLKASVVAFGGNNTNQDRSANVLLNRNTIFASLRRAYPKSGVLQVRGTNPEGRASNVAPRGDSSKLWIDQQIPTGLNLSDLTSLTSPMEIRWGKTSAKNATRDQPHLGFAELHLNPQDRHALLACLISSSDSSAPPSVKYEKGALFPQLIRIRDQIAKKHSNLYQPARIEELLLLDEEVLKPLIDVASQPVHRLTKEWDAQLQNIAAAAQILDYSLVVLNDPDRQEEYFIVYEEEPHRFWGTYLFRKGLASNNIVEVPRPLFERRSFEFGVSLFQQLQASALFIAGSHPQANRDGSADLTQIANKSNAFNLVHQAFLREMSDRPMLAIQSRAIRSAINADVVIATDDGTTLGNLSPLKKNLQTHLAKQGLRVDFVDGRESTAGYEVGIVLQATSLNHSQNKELVSLWVAPMTRRNYRIATDDTQLRDQLHTLEIPIVSDDAVQYMQHLAGHRPTKLPQSLQASVQSFLANHDIVRLAEIVYGQNVYQFELIDDEASGQLFLAISQSPQHLPCLINLCGRFTDSTHPVQVKRTAIDTIRQHLDNRAVWLELGSGR